MTEKDFLADLAEMLQEDGDISADTSLAELEAWDSVGFMLVIAYFDRNFGEILTFPDLAKCRTPADVMALSNGKID